MEFFAKNTEIDFMQQKFYAMIFSIFLAFASFFCIFNFGLNLGLDFTGGTQIELSQKNPINVDMVRDIFKNNGFDDVTVQSYGQANHAILRMGHHANWTQSEIRAHVKKLTPSLQIERIEFIGPQVGHALLSNGILAIIVSLIATMIYIALRFEMRFAISAAVSLIHDPVLILGVFALFKIEFNLISLAALLTILGYSLNDTIVVYDRVRENFRLFNDKTPSQIINLSVNQTLSRTIMTSGLTLIVVIALCLLGGETLRGFSIALIIGIIIGTYSSIYVAGALAVVLGLDRKALMPREKNSGLPQV